MDIVCVSATRPDPRTKSVYVEIERTSLRPDKVGGLVGDPSGPWVWPGRVRVHTVEFRKKFQIDTGISLNHSVGTGRKKHPCQKPD